MSGEYTVISKYPDKGQTNAQLVAVGGPLRGMTWRVSERGLLLGRSTECDIALPDPDISRRHARVFFEDGELRIEDLGSRNPVLLNGRVAKQAQLAFGDELAIGSALFVVAKADPAPSPAVSVLQASPPTTSWHGDALVLSEGVSDDEPRKLRPRTTEDLALVYEATTAFSRCSGLYALAEAVSQFIRWRFSPTCSWVALVHDQDALTFLSENTSQEAALGAVVIPSDLMRQAARECQGILAPRILRAGGLRQAEFTLVAPVVHAAETVAVLAMHANASHAAYDEDDLRVLVILARTLAPYIRAIQHSEYLEREVERLRPQAGESSALVGGSSLMKNIRSLAEHVARSDLPVLVTGETGTGKELVARAIHNQSGRHNMPLIIVNCAAIPRDLFEGELFGYEKGAYTGAYKSSTGLLAQAHGGTLFLDEIGDLSLENQARILRVVENRVFRRLGGKKEIEVNFRLVTATNRDLRAAIKTGKFREDLFHRINAMEIHIPPLSEHKEDIAELAEHFLLMFKHQAKRPLTGIEPEALDYLQSHSWSGNIRQLRNCIHRAVAMARTDKLRLIDVAEMSSKASAPVNPALTLAEVEKAHIANVFRQCAGNIQQAANVLGMARSTLYKKLAEHHIS